LNLFRKISASSRSKLHLMSLLVCLVFISSCTKTTTGGGDLIGSYNRTELLQNWVSGYIVPGYETYGVKVTKMESGIDAFCSNGTVHELQNCRVLLDELFLAWQDIAFLEFGPAGDISLRAQTNVYPIDTGLVQSNISSGVVALESAANFAAKGIQVFDYLFYEPNFTDEELVVRLTSEASKKYLNAVILDLKTNSNYVITKWGSYKSEFVENSKSNADGTSISTVINTFVNHYEAFVRRGKIGIPSGVFNGFSQQVMPGNSEAFYSGKSISYVKRSLNSMQNFLSGISIGNGVNGEGLDDYLLFVQAKKDNVFLSEIILNQFTAIESALLNISSPLSIAVSAEKAGVSKVYEEMQKLVSHLKVDLTSALGVLVNYADTDGD